jgi:hypothetical protein
VTGQVFPYTRFPILVGAWLVLSIVVVVLAPGFTRRLGVGLAKREGLAVGSGEGGEPGG